MAGHIPSKCDAVSGCDEVNCSSAVTPAIDKIRLWGF